MHRRALRADRPLGRYRNGRRCSYSARDILGGPCCSPHALRRFAFKGRVSTEAPQDPSLSMPHQLAPCRRPLEPTAGEVVAGT
jgi:hypothetical protein